MKIKGLFILLLCLCFFAAGCASAVNNGATADQVLKEESDVIDESIEESSNDISAEISDESSEESIEESSDAEVITPPQDSVVTFYGCGDNMAHFSQIYDGLENAAREDGAEPNYKDLHNARYNFLPYYEFIKEDIAGADISYINQETLVGGDGKEISAYPKFNSPKGFGDAVAELGFDVVNLAHNHMLDSKSTEFLTYSNDFFTEKGVNTLGYYPTEESVEDILIIEKNGIKVGFLTYTYGTNGHKPEKGSELVVPLLEEELIRKQVAIAKEKADFIIVSCHWGNEYTYKPNSEQKQFAQLFADLEVDVVLGMHSHCIQPVEWVYSQSGSKTLVVYSLGSMVSGIRKGMSALSGIFTFDIVKDGETGEISIENPIFRPAILHYIRGSRGVSENDTGSRQFKVYYLEDYTQELAEAHVIGSIERRDGEQTLIGGKFSLENLYNTVFEVIDEEFLDEEILLNKAE